MIFVLAGTSDARALALKIKNEGFDLLSSVVTKNAAVELRESGIPVQVGRLTDEDMVGLIDTKGILAVVDASHPFAEEASKNAIMAAQTAGVPYIRYERESQTFQYDNMTVVESYEEAAELALAKKGVVMLTTGSKTLQIFTEKLLGNPDIRLIARMLPRVDNMEKCEQLGLPQKNIVAIQGPFSKEFDKALYKQYGVTLMVTKESGKVGSVDEKVDAAKELGIEVIMIGRPKLNYGTVYAHFVDVIAELHKKIGSTPTVTLEQSF
ncbi:precorrin-6A reductase [Bacillus sp. AFS076308]|uniref:precorrin-6A reductase n=1 Tax=unclassified Bacillus (in: firmicutes) TaxID=185979 RepID=UPI000BF398C6|nr:MULTISPECIES: precorrin-6A reductase [unclassified Bacillus (in: firmicutes)]PFO07435.1 precorrin-6A reductase [Bacillus sp. AFS076308]PGV52062.1 precorrin-6A reductase [Bacillus sp. AFS037270]